MDASRRGFLLGRRPSAPAIRPPWALAESEFLAACTRCAKCVDACPTGIVAMPEGGLPRIDFTRGECTFCGACVSACTDGALQRATGNPPGRPWSLLAVIGDACLARRNEVCRACGDRCAVRAIRFHPQLGGAALPDVDAAQCTGCGACVGVCPAQAIRIRP